MTPAQLKEIRKLSSASSSISRNEAAGMVKKKVFLSKCDLDRLSMFPMTHLGFSLRSSARGILRTEAQPEQIGAITLS